MIGRREFIGCTVGAMALPVFDAFALETLASGSGRLVVLFLRGGLDGLFAIAPVSDPRLPECRPTLSEAMRATGIRLETTGFSAYPSCKALADLFAARELAFAPCAGTTDRSRSHFQAQDVFELGSGSTHGSSGFMARAAQLLGGGRGAISFTRDVPLAFQGGDRVPEVAPLSGSGLRLPDGRMLQAIRRAHHHTRTGEALEQAISTEAQIEAALGMEPQAARGAPGAGDLEKVAANLGQILRGSPRLTLSFLDLGGMDTHANEEAVLTRTASAIGDGLQALKRALGEAEWRRTRVAVMSEFGRTARENGTRGTDHGNGGLFLLAGGAINGGRMIGDFKGLSEPGLNENRDLPVLADWRALLGACMRDTFGLSDAGLDIVFPGRPRQKFLI